MRVVTSSIQGTWICINSGPFPNYGLPPQLHGFLLVLILHLCPDGVGSLVTGRQRHKNQGWFVMGQLAVLVLTGNGLPMLTATVRGGPGRGADGISEQKKKLHELGHHLGVEREVPKAGR